jgi:hypothetical protein
MNGTYKIEPYSFYNSVTDSMQSGTSITYYDPTGELELIEEYYGVARPGYDPQ